MSRPATSRSRLTSLLQWNTDEPPFRRRHQIRKPSPARQPARQPGRPGHRRAARIGSDPDQVPRQLPAGRPRPARRAPPAEAGAGVPVHDPHAHARWRGHAGAVAEAGRHRHPVRQPLAAHHHAPGVPVPWRDQARTEGDDAGHQRRADRHAGGLRRRQPQRAGRGQSAGVARARRGAGLGREAVRTPAAQHPRLLRDLAGRGARGRQWRGGGAHLRRHLSAAQVQGRFRGPAGQRCGRVRQRPGLHRHSRRRRTRRLQPGDRRRHGRDPRRRRNLPARRQRGRLHHPGPTARRRHVRRHHPARPRQPRTAQARALQVHHRRPWPGHGRRRDRTPQRRDAATGTRVPLRAQRRPLWLGGRRRRPLARDPAPVRRPHRRYRARHAPDRPARDRQRASGRIPHDGEPEPGDRRRARQ